MKKLLFFLILVIIPLNVSAISASSAILIDSDSGRVLYSKNANEQKLIASTSKIMTALVALENSKLDKKITIGDEILKAYGSAIYIEVGEKITLEDLLYGLMLRSGNDAAIAIANHISKNEEEFVKLMNDKAHELGMKNTIFINPHGLENDEGNGNMASAQDMAILMKEAMKNEDFRKIVSTKSHTVKTNKKSYVWKNKNRLLNEYEYTTGGKTGFTQKARRTLVTSATKNNKNLIAVTLNDPNDFDDHKNLYEEYFNKYQLVTLLNKKDKLSDKEYNNKILYIKDDIKLLVTKEEKKKLKLKIEYYKKDKYKNSNIAGIATVSLNNKTIMQENIYYKDKTKQKQENKNFIDKIKDLFI